jgi:hypothetical protein
MQFHDRLFSSRRIGLMLAISFFFASVTIHAQTEEKKEEQESEEEKGFPRFEEHVVVEASLDETPDSSKNRKVRFLGMPSRT